MCDSSFLSVHLIWKWDSFVSFFVYTDTDLSTYSTTFPLPKNPQDIDFSSTNCSVITYSKSKFDFVITENARLILEAKQVHLEVYTKTPVWVEKGSSLSEKWTCSLSWAFMNLLQRQEDTGLRFEERTGVSAECCVQSGGWVLASSSQTCI